MILVSLHGSLSGAANRTDEGLHGQGVIGTNIVQQPGAIESPIQEDGRINKTGFVSPLNETQQCLGETRVLNQNIHAIPDNGMIQHGTTFAQAVQGNSTSAVLLCVTHPPRVEVGNVIVEIEVD